MKHSDQQKSQQKPLPFKYQLLAGGVAGITEILLLYPLDVIKTRLQLSTKSVVAQQGTTVGTKPSMVGMLSNIVKREGFASLYRGIIPPILLEAPKRALKFSTNDQYTHWLKENVPYFKHHPTVDLNTVASSRDQSHKQSGNRNAKILLGFCTGIMAGCTEAFIVVPFELIKINLQDPAKKAQFSGTLDCVRQIYQGNANSGGLISGVAGFWRGLESTLWRHAVWSGTYFGVIGYIKQTDTVVKLKQEQAVKGSSYDTMIDFTIGVISGTCATLLNTPYDVVKTRIQNSSSGASSQWSHPLMFNIARNEGPAALWKGFVPKVVRLGPGGGVMLVVYTAICDFIRREWM
ncbi:hypothetical protein MIR68_005680 [Amoeboaphelidium protococcarum]|nr:hypothetical protein MIR68_005680 [Amoeboaphelidium protococcarum]